MSAEPLRKAARSAPASPARASIEEAIRRLLAALQPNCGTPEDEHDAILLDLEVDGVRCLLLREPNCSRGQPWLSPREWEIARMVGKGHPNKAIAAVLDISSWTVSTYLRRIFAKLSVSSRAAMVSRLHELALIHDVPEDAHAPPAAASKVNASRRARAQGAG